MKAFLLNKINILLGVLLSLTVVAGGYFGYTYIKNNSSATVPDFLGKNKNVAITWCGQLSEEFGCEFVYEETTSTQEDVIFSQSISAGNKLNGNITFKVSSGIVVEVALPEITATTSKTDIENWKNQNELMYVSYVEENNDTVAKGSVIRIEPQTGIYKDTPVTVYISTGPKETVNDEIVISSGTYINSSVSDFESKVKALGLVPNHNTFRDSESATVTKGNIVWHGSGTYKKGETINYGVCTGQVSGVVVKEGQYVNKTEAEFKTIASNLGLKATHASDRDEYSSTVAKGNIVTHGFGTYVKDEEFKYGLSLGPKDGVTTEVKVTENQYVGKTEDEFKTIASNLGLKATHIADRDEYSSSVAKGSIVTHGFGTYVKDEEFKYGLSLGPKDGTSTNVKVTEGQYVGKTEDEFKKIATDLGLKPTHISDRDTYSSTVAKGSIVTHGYGTYVKDEEFKYGLSLGPKEGDSTYIVVKEGQYLNKTEAEFKTIATNLGLVAEHNPDWDVKTDNASNVGRVCKHGVADDYVKGEKFRYGLYTSSGSSSSYIVVTNGQYVGKTEAEFIQIASDLGLKAYHESSWDQETSNSSNVGKVCTHGYSSKYEKGENFRYGLYKAASSSTEKVKVESGYVGKAESDFTSYLNKLGLKSSRTTQYSDSYAEGIVISYQTGEYTKGSTVSYTVSLGKDTSVNVTDNSGVSESEFLSYLSSNGLSAGTRSESYSSSIGEGKIISNDTGKMSKGSKVNYTVSLGAKPEETASIMRPENYGPLLTQSYDGTKANMQNALKGFTNVEYIGVTSTKGVGQIEKIEVNGSSSYSAGNYPLSTSIKVYIVSVQSN